MWGGSAEQGHNGDVVELFCQPLKNQQHQTQSQMTSWMTHLEMLVVGWPKTWVKKVTVHVTILEGA